MIIEGDCREAMKTIAPQSVHLTLTSPPYYNARAYTQYASYRRYLSEMRGVFERIKELTVRGRYLVVNTSPVLIPRTKRSTESVRLPIPFDLNSILVKMGWKFIDDIVWVKPEGAAIGRNRGFYQHRQPLMYKPNPVVEYFMVYRLPDGSLIDKHIRAKSKEDKERARIGDFPRTNVWTMAPERNKVHPAVMPLGLAEQVVRLYSYPGEMVFDPFGGSGTTSLAAKRLGRRWTMVEKDHVYAKLAKERLYGDQPNLGADFTL